MRSPNPTLLVISIYFMAVKFGPNYMKDKQPVKLKPILILYNLGITIFNGWMAFEVIYIKIIICVLSNETKYLALRLRYKKEI